MADQRAASWLGVEYAVTIPPSVSSLKSLRAFAKSSKASKPFLGVGDPVLEGRPGASRGTAVAALFRGSLADVRVFQTGQRVHRALAVHPGGIRRIDRED